MFTAYCLINGCMSVFATHLKQDHNMFNSIYGLMQPLSAAEVL